jgi:hypothetical protein
MKAFRFLILSVAAMASIAANGQKESSPPALGSGAGNSRLD